MDKETYTRMRYELDQLDVLGQVEVNLMAKTFRSMDRFMYARIHGVRIRAGGIVASSASWGASVEECVHDLYELLTKLPEGSTIVRSREGFEEEFRFDPAFGSWVRLFDVVPTRQ